jgi:nucleotide-binding universal stress UspA family protein
VFARIVVAVDGSASSQEALDGAARLARQERSILTGIFVIDSEWADFIGNDWQSAGQARQGFLDYVRREQDQQAEAARRQFESAAQGLEGASFSLRVGDPASVLMELAGAATTGLLVLSRRVFQVSGRPSLKTLGRDLATRALQPVLLFP